MSELKFSYHYYYYLNIINKCYAYCELVVKNFPVSEKLYNFLIALNGFPMHHQ
jgi:hypothetical protein